nr:immunoglobulin light chain junction region [Macaca mulatta]
CAIGHSSGEVF